MYETSNLPTEALRAPNRHPSSYPQSPRAQRADAKFAVGKIRQNTTQSHTMQRKLVPARAHARAGGNGVPFPCSWHGLRPGRSGFDAPLGVAVP